MLHSSVCLIDCAAARCEHNLYICHLFMGDQVRTRMTFFVRWLCTNWSALGGVHQKVVKCNIDANLGGVAMKLSLKLPASEVHSAAGFRLTIGTS